MNKFFGVFTLICILALTGVAFAATPQAGKPVQDKPEKTVDRVTRSACRWKAQTALARALAHD